MTQNTLSRISFAHNNSENLVEADLVDSHIKYLRKLLYLFQTHFRKTFQKTSLMYNQTEKMNLQREV